MTAVYLCYQSIADPLTMTQVVAYLEGLAQSGHRMFLVTFEPRRLSSVEQEQFASQLRCQGIVWSWLRYHKRPSVPATLWDVLAGVWHGWRLSRRVAIDLWHARGYVPGVMALALRGLAGGRFLFDIRGLMAEEYVDAGVWSANSWPYRLTKRAERRLLSAADGLVTLTQKGRQWLIDRHGGRIRGKPLRVIPCCVDLRRVAPPRAAPNSRAAPLRMAYVGKLGGAYLSVEMVRFFDVARQVIPDLRWEIWTQSDATAVERGLEAAGLTARVSLGQMAPAEIVPHLRAECHVALCLLRPCFSKIASSPTKVGEYLAAGLPVVVNAGIGDLDELLTSERVGIVLPSLDPAVYRSAAQQLAALLQDPDLRQRCLDAARQWFDLEHVGWSRYLEIYDLIERRS